MREESWEADGCFKSDFDESGDTAENQDGEGATTKPISARPWPFQSNQVEVEGKENESAQCRQLKPLWGVYQVDGQ